MDTGTLPPNEQETGQRNRRKNAGFFSSLLSKLGLGGSAGTEGGIVVEGGAAGLEEGAAGLESGASGLGGAADYAGSVVGASRNAGLFGGLLATKAGVLALILAGSTVAAGIGVVGSQLGYFGGSGDGGAGLFSPFGGSGRSGAAGAAGATAAAPAGQAATSIDYFKAANKGEIPDESAAPPPDAAQTTGAPAASPDVAKAVPDNANLPANVGGPAPAAAQRKAQMTPPGNPFAGGGGSAASFGGGMPRGAGASDAIAAMHGGSGAMKGGGGPKTGAATRSAFGRQGGLNKAMGQAIGARNDNLAALGAKNPTSNRAGLTYDGGSQAPGITGSGISGGGLGTGGSGAGNGQGFTPNPQNLYQSQIPPPPQAPAPKNATPYQWAIYAFIGAAALAMVLLMISSHYATVAKTALAAGPAGAAAAAAAYSTAKSLAMIATLLAAVATMMGVLIMTMYGQMAQGLMFTAIGGILTYYAAKTWMDDSAGEEAQQKVSAQASSADQGMYDQLGAKGMVQNADGTTTFTMKDGSQQVLKFNSGTGAWSTPGGQPFNLPGTNTPAVWNGAVGNGGGFLDSAGKVIPPPAPAVPAKP